MQHRHALWFLKHLMLLGLAPNRAFAHAAEQGFVLLLPTDLYTGAGVLAVGLTLAVLAVMPSWLALLVFWRRPFLRMRLPRTRVVTSCLSAVGLTVLIAMGGLGPRDPLANPLPLAVWTGFWIGLVTVQGLVGDVWRWLTPVAGPLALARHVGWRSRARLPSWAGRWLLWLGFFAFAYVLLADPAPSDPARLARIAGFYWMLTFLAALVFGRRWLVQGEVFTAMLRAYARTAVMGSGRIGLPGSIIVHRRTPSWIAILSVFLLATGSFDGLNETFWWLGMLGINPLEFPGRSAVIWQSSLGLVAANLALLAVFSATLWLGQSLTRMKTPPLALLRAFGPTLLPIALGYHIAHYLPSFMVDSQYALVALSDPFLTGADYLGLGEFYVSTGFFNTQESVRRIYLGQAGAIVAGHVIAVLTAHAVALRLYGSHRDAVLSQLPLAVFMVAYTWFGLWLLASPRF